MAEALTKRAVAAAVSVSREHGVEVRKPQVLSDRSNVMVRLAPAAVVARVATSTADIRAGGARDPARLLWTDFEDTCAGPVEWDLACLALSAAPHADEALEAYGRRHDDTLETFIEARRLQGAVWTALVARRHPDLRARAEERLGRWAPPR